MASPSGLAGSCSHQISKRWPVFEVDDLLAVDPGSNAVGRDAQSECGTTGCSKLDEAGRLVFYRGDVVNVGEARGLSSPPAENQCHVLLVVGERQPTEEVIPLDPASVERQS